MGEFSGIFLQFYPSSMRGFVCECSKIVIRGLGKLVMFRDTKMKEVNGSALGAESDEIVEAEQRHHRHPELRGRVQAGNGWMLLFCGEKADRMSGGAGQVGFEKGEYYLTKPGKATAKGDVYSFGRSPFRAFKGEKPSDEVFIGKKDQS
nr:receptor-like serine/threonine-protein kinase At1g78530 [Ipomoea batatas]